ncbi:P-loop containing nucleoside triphosphate hydrolase protein [Mycena latifolia]|nr:P-loop containing nucleoside triphosphate hydrolase protein [Mycena latifolia]
MSTSGNPPAASSSPQQRGGRTSQAFKPSSSNSDWLTTSLATAKAVTAGAECLPFPYVKGVFGMVVIILETIELPQKVKKNQDGMKELCSNIMEIIKTIQDQLSSHGNTAAVKFKGLCENLESVLQDVLKAVEQLQKEPRGFSGRFKEVIKLNSTTDEIAGHRVKIQELRLNFLIVKLTAAIDTNLQIYKGFSTVPQRINNCPPPTRIFHGRKTILAKMHQYFTRNVDKQYIFLLHGLGGAGKTQIALKFIEQSASQFTDIFVIDTSTAETIDTGLKTIATTKSVGDSSKDALQWLRSNQDEWLLFFDNADDPKINLNNYFPQCSHGNIIITSRNPGLCVYASSYCAVSDMEERDAVNLLLASAAQHKTDHNKDTAAQIVKVFHYLPLAIIQAGAFISRSGNLGSYLSLYEHNKAKLLTEQPVQTHDNYSWTVYTTWHISFEQLSEQAKTFLKLCSFLHYHGISENIFKNATNYISEPSSLSKEELEMTVKVLSQFSDPFGAWDPLRFMDVTNEIRAYSLINFDPENIRKIPHCHLSQT